MLNKQLFCGILAATLASSAFAAPDFYVVVPLKGRAAAATAPKINVALNSFSLPMALVGQPYSGFDFNSLLVVTGEASYSGQGVQWSIVTGALPAGLVLNPNGTLTGTPTAPGAGNITARAAYRSVSGEQVYQVVAVAANVVFQVGPSQDIAFAQTEVGKSTRVTRTLTNAGNVPASALSVNAPRGYSVDKSACPAPLPVGQSCALQVDFTPDEPRAYGGEIVVSSANNGWVTIPVTGTGKLPGPTYSASRFYSGTNASGVATLTNEGPGALTITDCKRTPAGGGTAVNCTAKDAWPMTWPEAVGMQGVVPTDTYYISLSNGQKVVWQPQSKSVSMQ